MKMVTEEVMQVEVLKNKRASILTSECGKAPNCSWKDPWK